MSGFHWHGIHTGTKKKGKRVVEVGLLGAREYQYIKGRMYSLSIRLIKHHNGNQMRS